MDNTPNIQYFKLMSEGDPHALEEWFSSTCGLRKEGERKEKSHYYDTFEWQLYNAGLSAIQKNSRLHLIDMESGQETFRLHFRKNPLHFSPAGIEPCTLKESLLSCTNHRALLRLCTIETEISAFRVLDEHEKTIGFIQTEHAILLNNNVREHIGNFLTIRPLKGYQEVMQNIADQLPLEAVEHNESAFKNLFRLNMAAAGLTVNGYTSDLRLSLRAADPIIKSACAIFKSTLAVMRMNEPGIIDNIDSEFLHDYRVALRKTRSLLTLLKEIFPPEILVLYQQEFKTIGKKTNALRDCDVYLLKKEFYMQNLPESLRHHLERFFIELENTRGSEQKRLKTYLRGSAYEKMVSDWKHLLQNELVLSGANNLKANESTGYVAEKAIKKAMKKVIRHGRNISADTPDREIHGLRIDCKKLRYLLEFFSSLFKPETIAPLLKQLKALQENLGAFVDLAVQQHYLEQHLASLKTTTRDTDLAAALGGLIAILARRQEKARKAFHDTFRHFDSDETEALFTQLLHSEMIS
ncbi:CHAD domain containing protein [Chlorobium phaeobacteroides DSM 266]|uniref:CHAD domain containing protein n=2 Tax=Chlorobium phaeobacteroides TaxID=1096 RepID=A1BG45_CHLPD|nr:CHAD domain containing protein [Chlorobium phaeobacteroides DSM 266]